MKIYVLFIEYEIIDLVTTDKQKLIDRVRQRGKLGHGDYVCVWEYDKEIAYWQDTEKFFNDIETNE